MLLTICGWYAFIIFLLVIMYMISNDDDSFIAVLFSLPIAYFIGYCLFNLI